MRQKLLLFAVVLGLTILLASAPSIFGQSSSITTDRWALSRYGFTSVFDTGSKWENTRRLRERVESTEIAGPRIHSTGEIIYAKGGAPEQRILDVVGTMRVALPEVSNAAEASAAARKLLDEGVDGIKLYATSLGQPPAVLSEAEIAAAAQEAHSRGKLIFAHPQTREGLLNAVHGGADIIVHTIPNAGVLDDSMLIPMKKAGVSLVPTLKLWRHELRNDRTAQREQFVASGVAQLRTWVASGGVVLFGTDVGYMDDYDTSEEFTLMGDAGMSFRQILASLTTAPAERFGESARLGRIAPGFMADMVVLDGDPSKDVRAFAAVRYTIRDGRLIYDTKTIRSPHLP
jgi:imidazolonepropionase-like amidohydrolase